MLSIGRGCALSKGAEQLVFITEVCSPTYCRLQQQFEISTTASACVKNVDQLIHGLTIPEIANTNMTHYRFYFEEKLKIEACTVRGH